MVHITNKHLGLRHERDYGRKGRGSYITSLALGTNTLSLALDLVILTLFMISQVRSRPFRINFTLPIVLGVIGLLELGAFLFGPNQFASFLKGQTHYLTLQYAPTVESAIVGSLILAAVTGALRAPAYRLWLQNGQVWRKGNALTVVLWILSLAAHLIYDAVITQGTAYTDLGDVTMLLYFAVSLSIQRVALMIRAMRLRRELV